MAFFITQQQTYVLHAEMLALIVIKKKAVLHALPINNILTEKFVYHVKLMVVKNVLQEMKIHVKPVKTIVKYVPKTGVV